MKKLYKKGYDQDDYEVDEEIPFVEGKVKDITAHFTQCVGVVPELERTGLEFWLEGRKEKFVFGNCPFRVDNGETVIVYSEMLGYKHDPGCARDTLEVNGLQVLFEDGSVVKNVRFQMSEGRHYFKEESQARKVNGGK